MTRDPHDVECQLAAYAVLIECAIRDGKRALARKLKREIVAILRGEK